MITDILKRNRENKNKELFMQQLPDGLDMLASGLRAGLTLVQAISNLVEEMPAPLSKEFEMILKENKLGISFEESLEKIKEKINDFNFDMFVVSVVISRQTGGNLANILNQISATIRERHKLRLQVKTLTAQGRLSGTIVSVLPFALVGIISLLDPNFIKPLFETAFGLGILALALIMEITGVLLIKKIVSIDI